jgi:predicted double-glycine peptidase
MDNEKLLTKDEKQMVLEALKRLINERKPIYEAYQRYIKNENNVNSINTLREPDKSKEGH